MKYFRVADDLEVADRWFLDAPARPGSGELAEWAFLDGTWLDCVRPLATRVVGEVRQMDITFATFDIPIVSIRARDILIAHAANDVQCFPVEVAGTSGSFFVLNISRTIRCISDVHSVFDRWTKADGVPEKIGQYKNMVNIVARRDALGAADIFRVDGWKSTIIVTEKAKAAIENAKLTGVRFEEVKLV